MNTSYFKGAAGQGWDGRPATGITVFNPAGPGAAPATKGDISLIALNLAEAPKPHWDGWLVAGLVTVAMLVCLL
jgi:hypothetical protein